jgi:acetyl esterase/lipase
MASTHLASNKAPDRTDDHSPNWVERRNIQFSVPGETSQLLDVYTPDTPPPPGGYPTLVAIHGGGWHRFNKNGYGGRIALAFVDQGFVVVAPNYELSRPDRPTWPVNLDDVAAAVAWARGNALSLQINPNEIAAIGESAGANLAALLGTSSPTPDNAPNPSAVDAVIAFSTPADLTSLYYAHTPAQPAVTQFLGATPAQAPATYAAASPADNISPADPPMLLVQGNSDPLIPVSQAVELSNALSADGVRNRLIMVDGGHNLDFPAHYANLIPQILEFLQTTWKD